MNIDSDKLFQDAIRDALRSGVAEKLKGYNSPLDGIVRTAIEKHSGMFRALLEEAIGSAVVNPEFRQEITAAVHRNLAKTLVQRFGGEIERRVNVLKSDPTTRARITLAIEEIVKSQTS